MSKHFLLIDDDPDELDFFLLALDKIPDDCRCSYAVNADAAFDIAASARPDYIFLDMNMPAVSGYECLQKIRKTEWGQGLPIYIYTTGYNDELRRKVVKAGASGCLQKPVSPAQLAEILKDMIKGQTFTSKGRNT
jgi:CheY-like chemotaxis protein